MFGSIALQAFAFGIISAVSLPLGALTSAAIKPTERFVAIMMALGGGALLAALTIDLVASALARGHFWALALGAALGGLTFIGLDQCIDQYGGFLRKASTTRDYIDSHRQKRFKRILSQMGRIDIFRQLPSEDVQALADTAIYREYSAGTTLYHRNDPCHGLYVIESGDVDLRDPERSMQPIHCLGEGDAFGRMAFFTGAPHATEAVTRSDTAIWILPRQAFYDLLKSSSSLASAVQSFLQRQEMMIYLTERHHLEPDTAREWKASAIQNLESGEDVQGAVAGNHEAAGFTNVADKLRNITVFQHLPDDTLKAFASQIFPKRHERGYTFYHQQEQANRLHIIEQGEVALIDPQNQIRRTGTLRENDAFGVMSFLTNAPHTSTAIAITNVTVWVLRRQDFEDLVQRSPVFRQAVKSFVQQQDVLCYLQERQHFDPQQIDQWVRRSLKRLEQGKLMPSASEIAEAFNSHSSAPIAIWLGLVLDGIPESLVIGSNVLSAQISFSLMAGIFLSNYPEALSSSVGMKRQGIAFHIIVIMWLSLMLITGGGALVGSLILRDAPGFALSLIEGLAVGSMLTMLAETMLPEAYVKGGSMVGLSTLVGFLIAVFFRTLE